MIINGLLSVILSGKLYGKVESGIHEIYKYSSTFLIPWVSVFTVSEGSDIRVWRHCTTLFCKVSGKCSSIVIDYS